MSKKRSSLTVCEALQAAMRNSGLSRRQIARLSGVDDRSVARFAKGERDLQGKSIDRICELLGLELTSKKDRHKR